MKYLKIVLFLAFAFAVGCTDENDLPLPLSCDFVDFKYYDNSQDFLGERSSEYLIIGVDTTFTDIEINNLVSTLSQFDQNYNFEIHKSGIYKYKEIPLKFNSPKTCEETTQIINLLNQNTMVSYAHFTMQTNDCNNLIWQPIGNLCVNSYSSSISVKVFDENNLTAMNNLITQNNLQLVAQNAFMPKWFELRVTKVAPKDALAMANYLYETGVFEYCEPNITKYPVE